MPRRRLGDEIERRVEGGEEGVAKEQERVKVEGEEEEKEGAGSDGKRRTGGSSRVNDAGR